MRNSILKLKNHMLDLVILLQFLIHILISIIFLQNFFLTQLYCSLFLIILFIASIFIKLKNIPYLKMAISISQSFITSFFLGLTLRNIRDQGNTAPQYFEFVFYIPLFIEIFYLSLCILKSYKFNTKILLGFIILFSVWVRILPQITFSYLVFGDSYYLLAANKVLSNGVVVANEISLKYFKIYTGFDYIMKWPLLVWISRLIDFVGIPIIPFYRVFMPIFTGTLIPILGFLLSIKALSKYYTDQEIKNISLFSALIVSFTNVIVFFNLEMQHFSFSLVILLLSFFLQISYKISGKNKTRLLFLLALAVITNFNHPISAFVDLMITSFWFGLILKEESNTLNKISVSFFYVFKLSIFMIILFTNNRINFLLNSFNFTPSSILLCTIAISIIVFNLFFIMLSYKKLIKIEHLLLKMEKRALLITTIALCIVILIVIIIIIILFKVTIIGTIIKFIYIIILIFALMNMNKNIKLDKRCYMLLLFTIIPISLFGGVILMFGGAIGQGAEFFLRFFNIIALFSFLLIGLFIYDFAKEKALKKLIVSGFVALLIINSYPTSMLHPYDWNYHDQMSYDIKKEDLDLLDSFIEYYKDVISNASIDTFFVISVYPINYQLIKEGIPFLDMEKSSELFHVKCENGTICSPQSYYDLLHRIGAKFIILYKYIFEMQLTSEELIALYNIYSNENFYQLIFQNTQIDIYILI